MSSADAVAQAERDKYERMWAVDTYRRFSPGEQHLKQAIEWLGAKPDENFSLKFYDYGCGPGRASLKLREMGFDVHMLDLVESSLDAHLHHNLDEHLTFEEACLWDLPHLPKRDYGLCCDVMEHIPPDRVDAVLENIALTSNQAFFNISLVPDKFGQKINEKLHLTLKSPSWWMDRGLHLWRDVRVAVSGSDMMMCCGRPRGFVFRTEHCEEANSLRDYKLETNGCRVAILCPGPSLNETWDERYRSVYQHVIGVNRVPTKIQCDYWAALDNSLRDTVSPIGSPSVIRNRKDVRLFTARRCNLTTLVAIAYAAESMGAEVIDLYGHDMKGIEEFDGTTDSRNNRTLRRWNAEKTGYETIVQTLAEHKVKVNRITVDGPR